jgi:phosphatidylserine decarboxylase
MSIPLTPHGARELVLFGGVLALCTVGAWWLHPAAAVVPFALLCFVFSFFRDPARTPPGGPHEAVSPADGRVTDIEEVDEPAVIGGRALRIGIFLSVFDVHVNRSPCSGEVTDVSQRPGGFFDARDKRAVDENRAATIVLRRPDGRRVGVRQITGLIARRIICPARPGQQLGRGERYGMIRFGSRTELIVPVGEVAELRASVGDTVRGGQTLLLTLRSGGGERG